MEQIKYILADLFTNDKTKSCKTEKIHFKTYITTFKIVYVLCHLKTIHM